MVAEGSVNPAGDNTLVPGRATQMHPTMPVSPANYRLTNLLGQGGVGKVYRAVDLRLDRPVAIKFLRENDPERGQRLAREALALARIEHENLCKVFEVGESAEGPYIAMQLIRGDSLEKAAATMTLQARLLALKQVAEVLEECHGADIIHRDLKPGNIMVEPKGDGRWKPYLMDFGLARLGAGSDLTLTGEVLGTPGYMAPEQVLGRLDELGRHTDVYGLGAILYFLVCDQPPYVAQTPAATFTAVLRGEPVRPQKLRPDLPRDLETITLKCLAREKIHRYQSAGDVAEDLGRFLNGMPLKAQPDGSLIRWWRMIRKYKLPIGLVTAAILAVLGTMFWGMWRASSREQLAREMTGTIKELEAQARYAYLSPRHDIESDMRRLKLMMQSIEARMASAGAPAHGPGHYALGWGHLILENPESALDHLDNAWEGGYRPPEVAFALAMAHIAVYRQDLAEAQLMAKGKQQAEFMRFAEENHRDPALALVATHRDSDLFASAFPRALVAFCEKRFEEGIQILEPAKDQLPWHFEIHLLEAECHAQLGLKFHQVGSTNEAHQAFDRSLQAFHRATHIGRSHPRVFKALARATITLMGTRVYDAEGLNPWVEQGMESIEIARNIVPRDPEVSMLAARLYRTAARRERVMGRDPVPYLEAGIRQVTAARELNAPASQAWMEEGSLYWLWAQWRNDRRESAKAMLERSIAALDKVEHRNFYYYIVYGSAWRSLGKSLALEGASGQPALAKAAEAFRAAVVREPSRIEAYNSLAQCLLHMADASIDPVQSLSLLTEAAGYMRRAVNVNPKHAVLRYQLGRILLNLAQEGRVGQSVLNLEICHQAVDEFRRGVTLNPKIAHLYALESWAYLLEGQFFWERGLPYETSFDLAEDACLRGQQQLPQSSLLAHYLSVIHYFRGKYRMRGGRHPESALNTARDFACMVLDRSDDSEARLILGSALRLQGEYALRVGNNPEPFLSKAEHAFGSILAVNPNHGEAARSLGRLDTLRAEVFSGNGNGSREALQRARNALDRAAKQMNDSPSFWLAEAHWHWQWHQLDGHPEQLGNLNPVIASLASRPDLPEVRAAMARLLTLPCRPESRRREGFEILALALRERPELALGWAPRQVR